MGVLAVLLSQGLIVSAWSDAKWGSLGNVLLLGWALVLFGRWGPGGLHAAFAQQAAMPAPPASEVLTEADLKTLPAPLARYIRASGALGQPRPQELRVQFQGRIRGGPDDEWMPFRSQQINRIAPKSRHFLLQATRASFPVDVLHRYENAEARMEVRLLSLFPLAREEGATLSRAETVTLFNDLCLYAPGALVSPDVQWASEGPLQVRGSFIEGPHRVSATLSFNQSDELIDFVSDDRAILTPEGSFVQQRWSTPVEAYRSFGAFRAASRGQGLWHPQAGSYPYVELEVTGLTIR
jgi:hypothetical protein